MTRPNGLPSTLTWAADPERKRTCSNLGHVITGARRMNLVVYNAWAGEPHQSKHLHQDCGADGLKWCKLACERHANATPQPQNSITEVAGS